MKAFLLACLALCLITVGANAVLKEVGFSAQERGTGNSVRLDP